MNHRLIAFALNIVLFLTAALFTYALAIGADLETMLGITFTGITCTVIIALNEKVKNATNKNQI